MPIYAYRCDACGFRKDALQKLSDPPLTVCPSCGASAFTKQLSAPAFQLKGTGWYVTDFRDNGKKADGAESAAHGTASPDKAAHQSEGSTDAPTNGKAAADGGGAKAAGQSDGGSSGGGTAGTDAAPAKTASSPAATPATKPASASPAGAPSGGTRTG